MGIASIFKSKSGDTSIPPELRSVLPTDRQPWYRTKHLVHLNLLLLVPLLSASAIGFDGAMMNGLQTLPQWRSAFNNPTGALLGIMNAIYPISKVFALFPATWIGDKYGRRKALLVGFCILPIGVGLQAAAQNLPMFIISRFVLGFGTVFIAQPSPILITELAYPTQRAKITSLYNTCFYFGAVCAAWSTYGTFKLQSTWSWRIPSLLQQAIPLFQTIFWYWVPESPRWLIAQGRSEEARQIFTRFHAGGDDNSPLVAFEMEEITAAIEGEQAVESSKGIRQLFATAPNRRRTAITFLLSFFTQWNGCSVLSYYLALVLNTIGIHETSKQVLINGMLQIFNWIVAVCGGALLVDRVGRRGLFLMATSCMFLSYIAWTALNAEFAASHNQMLGNAVLAFVFIYYFFYDLAWTPLPIAYTAEIFPYALRGRGMSTYYLASFLGLISSQFVNPIAMKAIGWKYYIVFCVVLFFLVIGIYFGLPETKGRTLEEIATIFDGPDSTLGVSSADFLKKTSDVSEVEVADRKR